MRLFKSTDDKLREIGFKKIVDSEYVVSYERQCSGCGFTHVLEIYHKKNGHHIVISYDKDLLDSNSIGNISVGLTYYETKLAMRKMKEKGWKSK